MLVDRDMVVALEQRALECFSVLAAGDAAEQERVRQFSEEMPDALFFDDARDSLIVFSVYALRQWLGFDDYQPQTFKQMLYQSRLNQRLSEHGLRITLYDNCGKVAGNLYQLVKIST